MMYLLSFFGCWCKILDTLIKSLHPITRVLKFEIPGFRILYIKKQNWVKYHIGEQRLLVLVLIIGGITNLVTAFVLVQHDHQSLLSKICHHYSETNLELINQYQVKR